MEIGRTSRPRRQRVANEEIPITVVTDRLSNLPEEIILHILSFLPTEASIRTGALAKSWKSMWKEMRHLNFDDKHHRNKFSDHVINALLSYQNRVLESLTITVGNHCDSTELAIWLGIALIKNVSKVVLRLNELGRTVKFPQRSLERTNTLKILKLMGNIIFDLPIDSVSLDCLKEMHLYHVSFENEVSFLRLLDGCPKLEDLVLDFFLDSGIGTLIINVPSLQRLTLASRHCIAENIVLQTPSLKYLNTKKLDGVDSFKMEDVSGMTEATITHHEEHLDENILYNMTSVQCLSLSAPLKVSLEHFKYTHEYLCELAEFFFFNHIHTLLPNKHPIGVIFDDLTSLEIETKSGAWCILLSHMLIHSPKLQCLKLVGGKYSRFLRTWIEPEHTEGSLLTHLHTVVWEEYNWDGADERDVATFILKNAAMLRDATFTILEPTEDTDVHQRQTMLAQLANVERASPSSNLSFKDTSTLQKFLQQSRQQDPEMETIVV